MLTGVHDPGQVILRRALRCAIILPLTFILVSQVLGLTAGASYAVFGTFALLCFADFGGPYPDRARAYLITGGVGMLAVALGTLAATTKVSAIAGTVAVAFICTYAGVLRGYVAAAAIPVLLPFVIAVTSGPNGIEPGTTALHDLWQREAAFAIAIVISTAAALLMWPVHTRSNLRKRVGEELAASANVMRAMWPADPGAAVSIDVDTRMRELVEAGHHTREQYDGRMIRPGGATARDRALAQTIEELQRLRIALRWRAGDDELHLPPDQQMANVTAAVLDQCAAAFGSGGPPPDAQMLDEARDAHRKVVEKWATQALAEGRAQKVEAALDAGFHLRLIAVMTELIARHTRIATGAGAEPTPITNIGATMPTRERGPWTILRANLTLSSPWLRNSLRSSLALGIAATIVVLNPGVQHGFWVLLGTITALRLDASGTGRTAVQAIAGTVGGFVVGTLVLLAVGNNDTIYWILLPIATFLAGYTPGAISLLVGQGAFTVFVIVFYGLIDGPKLQTGEIRVLDVGLGLVISLFVSVMMWPRGVVAKVQSTLVESIHTATAYLVAATDRNVHGPPAQTECAAASRRAQQALEVANESYDLAVSQGGTAAIYGQTWSALANTSGHVIASADLLAWLGQIGLSPVGSPLATDMLIVCAHHVQATLNSAVDGLGNLAGKSRELANDAEGIPVAPTGGTPDDPFPRLRAAVSSSIESWNGVSPSPDLTSGEAACALIWVQDWLVHLHWVAHRTQLIVAAAD